MAAPTRNSDLITNINYFLISLFFSYFKKLLVAENYFFSFNFAAHFSAAWTAAAIGRPHRSPVLPSSVPQIGYLTTVLP
jgi:hypothetical protein